MARSAMRRASSTGLLWMRSMARSAWAQAMIALMKEMIMLCLNPSMMSTIWMRLMGSWGLLGISYHPFGL